MEVWGFDPEHIVSKGKLSDRELAHEGVAYNVDEDDAVEIPAETIVQVSELWRMFKHEAVLNE